MKRNYDLRLLGRLYQEDDVVNLFDSATVKGGIEKCVLPGRV